MVPKPNEGDDEVEENVGVDPATSLWVGAGFAGAGLVVSGLGLLVAPTPMPGYLLAAFGVLLALVGLVAIGAWARDVTRGRRSSRAPHER